MGLSLRFYAGHAEKIISAVEGLSDEEFDYLESFGGTDAYAEFDLHLEPRDLDYLSEALAMTQGVETVMLRDCLMVDLFVSDHEDRGAYQVKNKWVYFVAKLPEDQIREVAVRWVQIMNQHYPDEGIVLNDDIVDSVRSLWKTCRYANTGADLIHVWFA